MNYLFDFFIVLGFLSIVLLIEGLFLTWNSYRSPDVQRINERLATITERAKTSPTVEFVKRRLLAETPFIEGILLKVSSIHLLDKAIVSAGLGWTVAYFCGLTLIAFFVSMLLATQMKVPIIGAFLIGLLMACLPFIYVLHKRIKRKNLIEQQLPEALDLMARAMLVGHAFSAAMKMVGDEMPEPLASEFRIVFDEINYGIPVHDALNNLAERVPGMDMGYFVISVLIQRETGGNLAELLGNLSRLIRERAKLIGTVRVLSAEGRLSAQILTLLPFGLALGIYLINPELMRLLWTDPVGLKWLIFSLVAMVLGILWMWRVIKIHV